MEVLEIAVGGMSCEGCVKSVTKVLSSMPGVSEVSVSLALARARMRLDPRLSNVAAIKAAIQGAGFEAGDAVQ
ncbi:MAG: heavy-metal-associated domain-containing protein [Uliginosibacterium sp.]|nr:heavy-metal-associated domain-containing protein [Uliginosibacterium sp.]